MAYSPFGDTVPGWVVEFVGDVAHVHGGHVLHAVRAKILEQRGGVLEHDHQIDEGVATVRLVGGVRRVKLLDQLRQHLRLTDVVTRRDQRFGEAP